MSLRFFTFDRDGTFTEFTDRVNRQNAFEGGGFTSNAEQGSQATSTMLVDDPLGDWDITGLLGIRIIEDEAAFKYVWAGSVAAREITRADSNQVGAGRQWKLTLVDENAYPYRFVLHTDDANRPAETDVARMQWLVTKYAVDSTYVSTAGPVDMDAADYRGQYITDVVDDCSQQSGKNWYSRTIKTGSTTNTPPYGADYTGGLVYFDENNTSILTSTLRISNVYADLDSDPPTSGSTTWAASADTSLVRDPSRVYSGVYMNGDGISTFRQRNSTVDAFALRDTVSPAANVKTLTKLNARADRYLVAIATEEDVITTTTWCTAPHVNDALPGDLISAKFTHLPGYEDFTDMRILNRTVLPLVPNDLQPYEYEVTYTLSPLGATAAAGSCTTAIAGATIYDSGADPSLGYPFTFSPSDPPTTPAVVIGAYWSRNHTTSYGTGPIANSTGGDFTQIDSTRTDYTGIFSSFGVCGYQAVSGATGDYTVLSTGFSGSAFHSRAIAVAFGSSSTSPVHSGKQSGSGGAVTLSGTPTTGNILVGVRFVEGAGTGSANWNGAWSVIGEQDIYAGTGSVMVCSIAMRCVVGGDTTSILVGDSPFSHWTFLTEWAP